MAVYTIELGTLIKSGYDIGLDNYPVPSYLNYSYIIPVPGGIDITVTAEQRKKNFRDKLNKKITDHYMFNEICCSAPDRFKQLINNTMNEIMPVKNLLYDALAENWKFYTGGKLQEDIEHTDGNKRELAKSGVDTVGNISSNNGYVLNVASDTPSQMLNIETDITNNTYASAANKNKSTGSSTSTNTTTYNSKDTDTYTGTGNRHRTVTGLNGKSYAELFKEYQGSLRNIDMEVIQALSDCFMSVF
nr:MAG TPA: Lower collar protein [Caudoviricetes sp.]